MTPEQLANRRIAIIMLDLVSMWRAYYQRRDCNGKLVLGTNIANNLRSDLRRTRNIRLTGKDLDEGE